MSDFRLVKLLDGISINITNDGILNNYSATTDPDVNTDSTGGYAVGSVWVNTSNDTAWICVDASVGAAIWIAIGDSVSEEILKQYVFDSLEGDGAYYFTQNASDLGGSRYEMTKEFPPGGGFTVSKLGAVNGDLIAEFATVSGYPNTTYIPSGAISFHVIAGKSATTKVVKLYAEFISRTLLGVDTSLGVSDLTDELTTTATLFGASTSINVVRGLGATDRLIIKIFADISGSGSDPDVGLSIQGSTSSRVRFPYSPVSSVNGYDGVVVLDKSDIGLSNVDNTSDVNKPVSTAQQSAIDLKQDLLSVGDGSLLYQNTGAGNIEGIPNWARNNRGGLNSDLPQVTTNSGYLTINQWGINVEQDVSSPDEIYNLHSNYATLDVTDTGNPLGTNGRSILLVNNNVSHQGSSDIGEVSFHQNYFDLGNGTDPIDVRGFSYWYGFGDINANVNVSGPIQGYGFQPNFDATATTDTVNSYTNVFYDGVNAPGTEFGYYTSFSTSPTLGSIANNRNFTGYNLNPNITTMNGNASFIGINVNGTLGTFGTGSFQGISINPTITSITNATGLNIDMTNVTGSNVLGLDVKGDVSINGSLSFTGALSIGKLSAFYASNPVDLGGGPQEMHTLLTSMTGLNGVTTANTDVIGVNTTMLMTNEANSINTSGPFQLGWTALALPCVVETQTGSSLDYMSAGTFAINLSGSSTGGTVDSIRVCRSVLIPNGVTTVNNSYGFFHHEPFGAVSSRNFGLYMQDASYNWVENGLKIGGTAGSSDTTTNKLEVEGSALFNGNLGFFNTTPIAQPSSSGVASAGGTYTATEQTMLQEVYDAVRALGLMS